MGNRNATYGSWATYSDGRLGLSQEPWFEPVEERRHLTVVAGRDLLPKPVAGGQRLLNAVVFVPSGALLVLVLARWRHAWLTIPLGLVAEVEGDQVRLSATAANAANFVEEAE